MIVVLWPGFWILLVPIVLVEALVARRVLGAPWGRAGRVPGEANFASTLAGVQLTWLVPVMVELAAGGVMSAVWSATTNHNPPSWMPWLAAPLLAPWFPIWHPEDSWMVAAAAMWLCGGFFITSVWLERRVIVRRFDLPTHDVQVWSWQANMLTYGMIEILLGALLVWTFDTA